jgi:endonuclease-3
MGTEKGSRAAKPPALEGRPRADAVRKRLKRAMPEPRCEREFASPWQLLIATILSAQSTDKMVNSVTPALFRHYPTPAALARAKPASVEKLVKSTGFYRNKAKSIQAASRMLVDEYGGEVPRSLEQLIRLPGVARKTANLVLGTAYGLATGFIVDTHAGRVARRLGLSHSDDAAEVEADLCGCFPKRTWVDMGHRFVLHGRYLCQSRKPDCGRCPLAELCPSAETAPEGRWTARADRERLLVDSRGASAG